MGPSKAGGVWVQEPCSLTAGLSGDGTCDPQPLGPSPQVVPYSGPSSSLSSPLPPARSVLVAARRMLQTQGGSVSLWRPGSVLPHSVPLDVSRRPGPGVGVWGWGPQTVCSPRAGSPSLLEAGPSEGPGVGASPGGRGREHPLHLWSEVQSRYQASFPLAPSLTAVG